MNQHAKQFDVATSDGPAPPPEPVCAAEPHIYGLFPARVRGVDATGAKYQAQVLLDNFGATVFDLRLTRLVEVGERLFVVAHIYDATIALHVQVLDIKAQADGAYRLTVAIMHYRFLLKSPARLSSG